eukprot:scaffold293764_cov30-Tisochrysis_lutea.AAC.9
MRASALVPRLSRVCSGSLASRRAATAAPRVHERVVRLGRVEFDAHLALERRLEAAESARAIALGALPVRRRRTRPRLVQPVRWAWRQRRRPAQSALLA